MFYGSCVAIGGLSGFLGGLLGIGGGVVIVPALIVLFDMLQVFTPEIATPMAVGTSLACIVVTSASAARAQMRANMVDWTVIRRWVAYLVCGSYLASAVALLLSVGWFRAFIGCFLLFVAFVMLTSWKPNPHRRFPGPWQSALIGTSGGLVSGVAGIGGGNVIVPTLVYFNIPVHRATATSSALGLPIAAAGALGYVINGWNEELHGWALGYVYLPCFLAIGPAALVAAPLGVRMAHRIAPAPLRRLFGLLLIVASGRMLISAVAA